MNKKSLLARGLPAAITAVAFAISSAAAFAAESTASQEVKIEAGKIVTVSLGHARNGMHPEAVQLSRNVSYADLDLATPSGAAELESRIRDTANSICKQLADVAAGNALEEARDQKACVDGATSSAMAQARRVIASAEGAKQRG